jgi:L-rhamnose mutarotase
MQRIAFRLRVRPDRLDEYRAIHQDVWPELLADLRASGYRNYSIFADGNELFGYLECDDWDAAQRALATSDANRRWQAWMAEYLETPVDPEGKRSLHLLDHVFFME